MDSDFVLCAMVLDMQDFEILHIEYFWYIFIVDFLKNSINVIQFLLVIV